MGRRGTSIRVDLHDMQMDLQVVQEIALYAILLLFLLIGMCSKLVLALSACGIMTTNRLKQ